MIRTRHISQQRLFSGSMPLFDLATIDQFGLGWVWFWGISHSYFSFLTITLCLFLAFCDRLCNIVIYLVLHFPGYYWHQSSYFSNDSMKLNVWDEVSLFKCVSTIHYLSWDAFMDWVNFFVTGSKSCFKALLIFFTEEAMILPSFMFFTWKSKPFMLRVIWLMYTLHN